MTISSEDIRAYHIDREIVCSECVSDKEDEDAEQDDIILDSDIENSNDRFYCDRCKKRI